VLVLTVDLQNDTNRETQFRSRRCDDRECSNCHESGFKGYVARKPMFDGLDVSKATGLHDAAMNWTFVDRLRDTTKLKLLIKGLVTREDAQLAVEHGVDGIVVSNHGGRTEETLRSTIESLPEVVDGVKGKDSRVAGRRSAARHRHLQGAGARCDSGRHRAAVCLGTGQLRSVRRGGGALHPAARTAIDDAPGGNAVDCRYHQVIRSDALVAEAGRRLHYLRTSRPLQDFSRIFLHLEKFPVISYVRTNFSRIPGILGTGSLAAFCRIKGEEVAESDSPKGGSRRNWQQLAHRVNNFSHPPS
jgi:hypothetical protein